MVGARGFEPPTSATPLQRASQAAPRPDRGVKRIGVRPLGVNRPGVNPGRHFGGPARPGSGVLEAWRRRRSRQGGPDRPAAPGLGFAACPRRSGG